ncbi:MAG TPA: zinc-binding dehydrogenase, partial [Solirubrobacteraceae bacterium]
AGPIGLLAALLGVQRGLDVHVLDRVQDGVKPELVRGLGATYLAADVREAGEYDVVVEATGAPPVVLGAVRAAARGGIVCLTGVAGGGDEVGVDVAALNDAMVLGNQVVFGSVNANRAHYEAAVDALARADRGWLEHLVSRRVPLEKFGEALERGEDDVKVVVELG